VISYDTWQRQFGGDPHIIGHRVRLPEVLWNPTIVGVAPPGLDYPHGVQMWTPNTYPGGNDLVGRLKPGSTAAAARADYTAFVRRDPILLKQGVASQIDARVEPLEQMVSGDVRPALFALVAAVAMLLLLACVNIANLVLLRASGRTRELAVRRALGAASGDIIRQVAAESGVLAGAGGLLGLGFSLVLLSTLVRIAPASLPRLDMVALAPTPLAITGGLTIFTVMLIGMLPAVGATRFQLLPQLRADARSGTEGRGLRMVRRGLVASQMALGLLLLAGAGLLVRSFARLSGLDLGFGKARVSVIGCPCPGIRG